VDLADALKRTAAHAAVDRFVRSGMVLGLGTGSTAAHVVRRVGALISSGELENMRGIATSARTEALAREVGVPLTTLAEDRPLLTIDGADEIGPGLALVKGRGGALLREKIVAHASREGLVVVADETKPMGGTLGSGPLPVEVDPFGHRATLEALASLGCEPGLRRGAEGGQPYVTDGGHYIADCVFEGGIPDPGALEDEIKRVPGALECGLFVGLARAVVIGRAGGEAEVTEA
jgi:ribose 5-phosphate isomerase A